jgi:hypothetical protein
VVRSGSSPENRVEEQALISDVPTPKDFFDSGIELFDFAWDTVANLITNFSDAVEYGVEEADVSEEYWAGSKRRLTTALAMTQQGVEFILKGKIAEVSPFLLLAEGPTKWPSPYDGNEISFSAFKTVDAQDLVRLHDTIRDPQLDKDFVVKFTSLRLKRNTISHSVDKKLQVHTTEVIEAILFMYKALFPTENWAKTRTAFIHGDPVATLNGGDYSRNRACCEMETVFELLPPAAVERYFGLPRKQRRYICPACLYEMDRNDDRTFAIAVLRPKGPTATSLYCPICDCEHKVVRKDCTAVNCKGNVLSDDDSTCPTCGR